MLIHLTGVSSAEGKVTETQVEMESSFFKSPLGEFEIIEKTPVKLTLSNIGIQKVQIKGTCKLTIRIPCDRCLDPVPTILDLSFTHEADLEKTEDELRNELEEKDFIEGFNLNVDKLLFNEILMNWPLKVLCKEDCKGICKKCGQNLNEGACDCDTVELDPRMAAIKDIFSQY